MANAPLTTPIAEKPRADARGFGESATVPALVAAVAAIIADRTLKSLVFSGGTAELLGSTWLSFRLFRNGGIAFSLPLSGIIYWIFAVPLLAAIGHGFLRAWRMRDRRSALALGMILLGALSNGYDRVAHGFVVDYLIFFGLSAVNIADGLIVGGILLLILNQRRPNK